MSRRLLQWIHSSSPAPIFNQNARLLCCGARTRIRDRAGTRQTLPRTPAARKRRTIMSLVKQAKSIRMLPMLIESEGRLRMRATAASLLCVIAFLGLLAMSSAPTWGQTAGTGAISGTVSDPSGAIVEDVKITVTSNATGGSASVTTSRSGTYLVPLLLPGTYRVEVSKEGFKLSTYPQITVNVTETESLNIRPL